MSTQIQCCAWFKYQHSKDYELFFSIMNEARMSPQMGKLYNRMGRKSGVADTFLAKPVAPFHGLFIEIKKDGYKMTKSDTNHVQKQVNFLWKMSQQGYSAHLVVGFEQFQKVINYYLQGCADVYSCPLLIKPIPI